MAIVYSRENVKVAKKNIRSATLAKNGLISKNDLEMDTRAEAAVKAAIRKLEIRKKPVAKFDADNNVVYLEYPNGEKKIVK